MTTGKNSGLAENVFRLKPDRRLFLVPIVLGILLVPLLGLGIWVLYRYHQKWKRIAYRITDHEVTLQDGEHETIIPVAEIESCEATSPRLLSKFGLGHILIRHSGETSVMLAIENPEPIAGLLEQAASSERERMKLREEVEQTRPTHPTGTLDKKNELVGYWQQGLISEEDYRRELKKFE
ncbi:hypothetical protein QA596_09840 [Balneolales bacterium ANBcel1]|nr:hypothetical protein [Balneolales bacterium ANBcel1]